MVDLVGHDGERQIWITTGEAMSSNVAIALVLQPQIKRR